MDGNIRGKLPWGTEGAPGRWVWNSLPSTALGSHHLHPLAPTQVCWPCTWTVYTQASPISTYNHALPSVWKSNLLQWKSKSVSFPQRIQHYYKTPTFHYFLLIYILIYFTPWGLEYSHGHVIWMFTGMHMASLSVRMKPGLRRKGTRLKTGSQKPTPPHYQGV